MLIGLIIVITVFIIYIICTQSKLKNYDKELTNQFNKYKEQLISDIKSNKVTEINNIIDSENKRLDEFKMKNNNEVKSLQTQSQQLKDSIASITASLKLQEENTKELIREQLDVFYTNEYNSYKRDLAVQQELIKNNIIEDLELQAADGNLRLSELNEQIIQLEDKLNDYKLRVAAVNEQIRRQRELEEQTDFYRICLTEDDINDISILNNIKSKLLKIDLFNKLIYDNYISRYVKEMIKRVLKNQAICGIYKVTNISTNEIYIGKSTDIANRWQSHNKSAAGLEGVADSQFQRALKKYGIQNFTWELLEEVPKDKLTEREKYWIAFYDTVTYGYNQKIG